MALDLLIALVERAGELVGKGELVARVRPNTVVEESNLKFQIAALRWGAGRDGKRYIAQITGAGRRRSLNGGTRAATASIQNEKSSADFDLK